ncbi:hypothetical protein B5F40_06580 [Gordonibacter sp. An230]|uniref:thiol-activated cytolysin family protein n=1 Tax=Gordonibacter sp. An230 TaxID=1965592 RepID=UPI000B3733B0|nr:thiol-activated cytolysin family protein [Gordonibacter sp. An230]OUO90614.1 hypothetical protein B5F40_06580 [Gordonibacter sp. An230]
MESFEMINRSENASAINEGIWALDYRPEEVMAFSGEKVESFVPRSGRLQGGSFVVVEKSKHSISGQYDIAVPNARKDVAYPGGLLLGNQRLVEGVPDPLVLKRRPMTLTIDLPGLTGDNHVIVQRNDYTGVSEGVNTLLNNWLADKASSHAIPANMQYKKSILYDKKSMALTFGCDVEYMQSKLGLNFDSITRQETSAYLIQFRQIYYTVSAELPAAPADVFADEVTWEDVRRKVDSANPPCYVQNVQYGREVYLLFQSSMGSSELKSRLDSSLKVDGGTVVSTGEMQSSSEGKDIDCTIVALGGRPVVVNGNLENDGIIAKVNDLISENAVLSAENPAFPLAYTVAFLKDNRIASIQGTTEYITSTATEYRSGTLVVQHQGAYVARFSISWSEVSYDEQGNEIVEQRGWQGNGAHVTAGYSASIPLPANARDIRVRAYGATGLAWEPERMTMDETFPLIARRTITIGGTTLNQVFWADPEK